MRWSTSVPMRASATCRSSHLDVEGQGPIAGLVEFGLQGLIDSLQGQDGSDADQIESVIEESADLPETTEIFIAVAAGATFAAGRIDQAPGLIEPKVLWSAAHQFGRYGDSIQALARIGAVILPRRSTLRKFSKTTCIRHGGQGITNL